MMTMASAACTPCASPMLVIMTEVEVWFDGDWPTVIGHGKVRGVAVGVMLHAGFGFNESNLSFASTTRQLRFYSRLPWR